MKKIFFFIFNFIIKKNPNKNVFANLKNINFNSFQYRAVNLRDESDINKKILVILTLNFLNFYF